MNVVINSECRSTPEESVALCSQGKAFLNFLAILGYDPMNPPAADLLRQCNRLEGDWLVLSPVHWQATHNDAHIVATGQELQINKNESEHWYQLYADYLAHEDMTLFYHEADLWLLSINNKPLLNAKPIHHVVNKSLMPELKDLDSTLYWQKFITEGQMFFASQLENSMINGVWLWGGGLLTNKKSIKVCADENFLATAQILCSDVTLYHSSLSIKEFEIIILNDYDSLSEQHKEEIKKIPVSWYWNNAAYTRGERNWFTRLWRTLIHAH